MLTKTAAKFILYRLMYISFYINTFLNINRNIFNMPLKSFLINPLK